jgi:hypothetical protein
MLDHNQRPAARTGGGGGGGTGNVIAALYVEPRGVYANRPGIDTWDEARDARLYPGPHAVVAHPPCASWGRYAKLTPASLARSPLLGDDAGCFAAAVASVRRHGGVLEHPAASKAWPAHGIPTPPATGWSRVLLWPEPAYVCAVEQGHYGHAARKPTWLLYVGPQPPDLIWGPSIVPDRPGPSRCRGILERMSHGQRLATPPAFAEVLIGLATWATDGLY